MNNCDNCLKSSEKELNTVKWPGLDASMQYEDFCDPCHSLFIIWRNPKSPASDRAEAFKKLHEIKKEGCTLGDLTDQQELKECGDCGKITEDLIHGVCRSCAKFDHDFDEGKAKSRGEL